MRRFIGGVVAGAIGGAVAVLAFVQMGGCS